MTHVFVGFRPKIPCYNDRMATNTPTLEQPVEAFPPASGVWTYADYLKLPDDGKRYEILEGSLIEMPSPIGIHQLILSKLTFFITSWVLKHSLGFCLVAPMDVVLENVTSVVQPDLLFIANDQKQIFDKEGAVKGSPRLLVEILSPSIARYDRADKLAVYEQAGVKEYWIINPKTRSLEVYYLEATEYAQVGEFTGDEKPESPVLGQLEFALSELFEI